MPTTGGNARHSEESKELEPEQFESEDLESKEFERVKTHISGVFWHDPRPRHANKPFVLATEVTSKNTEEVEIFWLDRLFGDGILLPKRVAQQGGKPFRALTMVISGPPGSGKSTLAMELCYRFAEAKPGLKSAYVAIEGHSPWLVDNGRRLWPKSFKSHVASGKITIHQSTAKELKAGLLDGLTKIVRGLGGPSFRNPPSRNLSLSDADATKEFDVVVLDSLDVIPSDTQKAERFQFIMDIVERGPRLLIFILDSNHRRNQEGHEFWEYICDVALRMDRTFPVSAADGYMIRTIEIVKARYQQHAWGPQQIKLYEAHDHKKLTPEELRRAFPFRSEGGLFIYPSIHYLLSIYKRSEPTDVATWASTPIRGLNVLLGSLQFISQTEATASSTHDRNSNTKEADRGFPEGRCIALVGERGGHKSRIAVIHIISQILDRNESGIIVTLRDDVPIVNKMIEDVLSSMDQKERNNARKKLETYLELMYFAPGNITPEEFLHRILLSVLRLKALGRELKRGKNKREAGESDSRQKITLLFNSVDGLAPRFPLCAKEPLFLAALVHVLSSHSVTSIIVGAANSGKPSDYLGLYAIAELIVSFSHCTMTERDTNPIARAILEHAKELNPQIVEADPPTREAQSAAVEHWLTNNLSEPHVLIQILRHAGSHPAGSRAIALLIDRNHPLRDLFGRLGLYCVPVKWAPTERRQGYEIG